MSMPRNEPTNGFNGKKTVSCNFFHMNVDGLKINHK